MIQCPRCGGGFVQKPFTWRIIVGLSMFSALGLLPLLWPVLWIPPIVVGLMGEFLVFRALIDRGRWCCACERWCGV
jgi:hypothetical protein